MPEFDVQAARQAGATDDQILSYLAQRSPNFDVQGALGKASKADVINYLATRSAGPAQPPPQQRQQPTATIGPRSSGANSWLNDLESDVRYGGQSTFVGKALHVLGAQGTDVGAQAGTQENMLASPILGPIRTARGVTEIPNAPWQATKDIAGGALQTASLPAAFIAPEAGDVAARGVSRAGAAVGNRLVPSMIKQKAGQLFNAVAEDAGNVPVALQNSQEAALRLMDMQKVTNLGPTVNKFLNRVTKPGADPLTYSEARDFYSALSEMSWGDRLTLNPKVQYFSRQLVAGLKQDIGNAAEQVGQAANYYQAMGQYARAQRLKAAYLALPGVAYMQKKYNTLSDLAGAMTDIAGSAAGP